MTLSAPWASECLIYRHGPHTLARKCSPGTNGNFELDFPQGYEYVFLARCMKKGLRSATVSTGPVVGDLTMDSRLEPTALHKISLTLPQGVNQAHSAAGLPWGGYDPNCLLIDESRLVPEDRGILDIWAVSSSPCWIALDCPEGRFWRKVTPCGLGVPLEISVPKLSSLRICDANGDPISGAYAIVKRGAVPVPSQPRGLTDVRTGWTGTSGLLAIDARDLVGRQFSVYAEGYETATLDAYPKDGLVRLKSWKPKYQKTLSLLEFRGGVTDYYWAPERGAAYRKAGMRTSTSFFNAAFRSDVPGKIKLKSSLGFEQWFAMPSGRPTEKEKSVIQVQGDPKIRSPEISLLSLGGVLLIPDGSSGLSLLSRPKHMSRIMPVKIPNDPVAVPPSYGHGMLYLVADNSAFYSYRNGAFPKQGKTVKIGFDYHPAQLTKFRIIGPQGEPLPYCRLRFIRERTPEVKSMTERLKARRRAYPAYEFSAQTDETGCIEIAFPQDIKYYYRVTAATIKVRPKPGVVLPGKTMEIHIEDSAWLVLKTKKEIVVVKFAGNTIVGENPYGKNEWLVLGPFPPGPIEILGGPTMKTGLQAGEVRRVEF